MRLHLPTAILLSVLVGSHADEPDHKPFQTANLRKNGFLQGRLDIDHQAAAQKYIQRHKKAKKSQQPSSFPSFSPSTAPSASPSGSPSAAPSAKPSSTPSDSPSSQPSSSPSAKPSSSPSDSPSSQPSSSPSADPSSLPSASPSEERERFLYLGDRDTCSSKVSVDAVEQMLGAFPNPDQEDGPFDKMAIMETLEEYSSTLQMVSLGLSKNIDYGSMEFVTELIVTGKIESELFPLLDELNDESRENFYELLDIFYREEKAVVTYAVELMEGIRVLKEDFKSFVTSREDPDEILRLDRTQKFRERCKAIDSKPIDMFRHVYDYGCGHRTKSVACTSEDFGECKFGLKGPIHVTGLPVESMDIFFRWISATLVEISLLHAVCLPAMADTYSDPCINPNILSMEMDDTFATLKDAAKEVFSNVSARSNCKVGIEKGFELCRINSEGFAISPRDPQYVDAEPVFASSALQKKITGDGLGTVKGILSKTERSVQFAATAATTASGLLEGGTAALKNLSKIGTLFGGVGAALSFAMFFLPSSDPTMDAIREGFQKVDARLDELSTQVKKGTEDIIAALNEQTLDAIDSNLQRIRSSYSKYMELADPEVRANPSYGTLVEQYREEFRIACNELDSKPEDIIRELYGYACGDADFSTRCPVISASSAGVNIGQCGLGIDYAQKNNNFMIDKYFAQSNDLTAFRTFSAFMKGALLEALFLQQVCLPPISDTCFAENDSIRDQALQNSIDAITEVEKNLEDIEKCYCPCGVVSFEYLTLPSDGFAGGEADLTVLDFKMTLKDYSPPENRPFRKYLPGQEKDSWDSQTRVYKADVIDTKTVAEILVPEEDPGLDLTNWGTEYLGIVSSNYFYRDFGDIDFVSSNSFPFEIIQEVNVFARDADGNADDKYNGRLDTAALRNKINFKCATDTVSMELPEVDDGSKGKFTFNMYKFRRDQCHQFSGDSGNNAFCSRAIPDCPDPNNYYCDFANGVCKSFKQINEICGDNEPCQKCDGNSNPCERPLQCLELTLGQPRCEVKSPCKRDYDCGEHQFCGELPNNDDLKICKDQVEENSACNRSGECKGSYCNAGTCTSLGERGDSCNETEECKTDMGLQCVDGLCKDDFDKVCFSNKDCGSTPGLYCDGAACKGRKAIGSECTVGSECTSGFCDPNTGICENRPPPPP